MSVIIINTYNYKYKKIKITHLYKSRPIKKFTEFTLIWANFFNLALQERNWTPKSLSYFTPTYKVPCLEDYSLVEYKVYRSTVTEKICRLHFRAISRIYQSWKQILPKGRKSFSYTVTSADWKCYQLLYKHKWILTRNTMFQLNFLSLATAFLWIQSRTSVILNR